MIPMEKNRDWVGGTNALEMHHLTKFGYFYFGFRSRKPSNDYYYYYYYYWGHSSITRLYRMILRVCILQFGSYRWKSGQEEEYDPVLLEKISSLMPLVNDRIVAFQKTPPLTKG
jgi:hypothetical protein